MFQLSVVPELIRWNLIPKGQHREVETFGRAFCSPKRDLCPYDQGLMTNLLLQLQKKVEDVLPPLRGRKILEVFSVGV